MTKFEILSEIFNIENIHNRLLSSQFKMDSNVLLTTISKKEYSLDKDTGVSVSAITRTLKFLWPERPVTNARLCSYLLAKYSYKFCPHCEQVKDLDDFHKNSTRGRGYNTHCKTCCIETRRDYQRFYQKTYRASKENRTPSWANLDKIRDIYANCPVGYHVDHIVPLHGDLVSGLHVETNLQYLAAEENIKKNNTFIVA